MLESTLTRPEQTKVLIVDDEPANVAVLSRFLEHERYHVLSAENGPDALDTVSAEEPSLVLLDVMMPAMNGFEVCRRIKSSPTTLFLPVVLVTGLADTESRVKGILAGADDFLSKPVDRQELVTRVKSLLRIKSQYDPLSV